MLEWAEVTEVDNVEGEGYSLYMDDGYHGEYSVVYNGTGFPETRSFLVTGLTSGLPYRFEVTAHSINGESARGPAATIYACLIPSNLPVPLKVSTTKTSVLISWTEPDGNGCPATGFQILRNNGANDAITVTVDAGLVADKASLREYGVTGLTTSATYLVKVRALNYAGYFDSDPLEVVIAAVPDTPLDQPTSDATVTNKSRIKVFYGPLTAAQNGGSDILSYELQMDDGIGGEFASLSGGVAIGDSLHVEHTVGTGLTAGGLYRFRYRARNVNGWSAFS